MLSSDRKVGIATWEYRDRTVKTRWSRTYRGIAHTAQHGRQGVSLSLCTVWRMPGGGLGSVTPDWRTSGSWWRVIGRGDYRGRVRVFSIFRKVQKKVDPK